MLKSEIDKIPTKWKDLFYMFIDSYPEHWDCIENIFKDHENNNEMPVPIYPKKEDIFRCFHYFDPLDTKVVIIGQDPYHGKGQATGLCFGINKDMKKPPSLKNIEKELMKDYNKKLDDQTLESWAKQNILMLNVGLTVLEKKPRSHIKLWKKFTYYIIHFISNYCKDVVFVVWGGFALNVMADLQPDTRDNGHKLLVSSHPSPLGYTKTLSTGHHSFKDSKVFIKINELLEKKIDF